MLKPWEKCLLQSWSCPWDGKWVHWSASQKPAYQMHSVPSSHFLPGSSTAPWFPFSTSCNMLLSTWFLRGINWISLLWAHSQWVYKVQRGKKSTWATQMSQPIPQLPPLRIKRSSFQRPYHTFVFILKYFSKYLKYSHTYCFSYTPAMFSGLSTLA